MIFNSLYTHIYVYRQEGNGNSFPITDDSAFDNSLISFCGGDHPEDRGRIEDVPGGIEGNGFIFLLLSGPVIGTMFMEKASF